VTVSGTPSGNPRPVAGAEILDPSLVVLRVRKSGPKAIGAASFDRPLTFTFDEPLGDSGR
jgi:hypothetical protein